MGLFEVIFGWLKYDVFQGILLEYWIRFRVDESQYNKVIFW
jgi:hypothetical protein